MKRIVSLVLTVITVLSCVFAFSSCSMKDKISGTYEMTDISGSITANGTTQKITKDLYEYYTIELEKNGKGEIRSKGANGVQVEEDITWEWEDDVLKIKSKPNGITIVEEMEWNDGVITYKAKQSAEGMTINMTIVLEKQ